MPDPQPRERIPDASEDARWEAEEARRSAGRLREGKRNLTTQVRLADQLAAPPVRCLLASFVTATPP